MSLSKLRKQLQMLDDSLLFLLSQRKQLILQVAAEKQHDNLPALNPHVALEKEVRLIDIGSDLGLSPDLVQKIWQIIHQDSVKTQEEIFDMSNNEVII
jgi:chorismate mutase